ncbi:uncharacterized protein LOC127278876 [Leptopilina boulardi]|uniref:uncharacterized protein LOC127278876 n=1 Tax=Leptopilina boulardi TaxID=63433 RepID=UPI0021F5FE72|nr:uncharacterized protein LOC127278876 [Leptopilina boulardi]
MGTQTAPTFFCTETTEVGVEVKSEDSCNNNFSNDVVIDKELSTLTGIEKSAILDTLVKIVELIAPRFQFHNAKLTIRQRIIMCFMKLKHNLSYALLTFLFKSCSERHCQSAIVFPSKEEIDKNLPTCFEDFKTTRIVLDCTEINIQKPKNLCCQLATYSFYKSTYTVKYMTGVTPGGLISFLSKGYGGRASEKAIFEQSGLLELMKEEKNQSIMVDKGFLIEDVCNDYGMKLIRPPFVKNKKQFAEEGALNTCNIDSARVHVERDNQRLKVFAILGSRMPSCLVAKCDKIMPILCAIVNLSSPILQDNRFLTNVNCNGSENDTGQPDL